MNREQQMVAEFCRTFGHPFPALPALPPTQESNLWMLLIAEEWEETGEALEAGDLVKTADGIADMLYVVYGLALACGLDMAPLVAEVHRSNMTKLGADGTPVVREDGKILKGPHYEPPRLAELIAFQQVPRIGPYPVVRYAEGPEIRFAMVAEGYYYTAGPVYRHLGTGHVHREWSAWVGIVSPESWEHLLATHGVVEAPVARAAEQMISDLPEVLPS